MNTLFKSLKPQILNSLFKTKRHQFTLLNTPKYNFTTNQKLP